MSDKEEYMARLDKIERDLSWIIQYLLKKDESIPIPPYNPYQPYQYPSTICPKCNLNMKDRTGYVCPNMDCPTQPKITCGDLPGSMSSGGIWTDENGTTHTKVDGKIL